jgi:hypothetical protein
MKKIFITALILAACSAAQAHTRGTAKPDAAPPRHEEQSKPSKPAPDPAPKGGKTAASSEDMSGYVGTNDFYMALVREGVRKA